MMDNIQIMNKNGEGIITEGLSYLMIPSTNKKYLFYTLNEKVDNDLTKIYIAETSDQVGGANPISDTEWDDLRKKMVKISHKEEVEDVTFLKSINTYNVGDPKKLAITSVAKQAFKDMWANHTIPDNQTNTAVANIGGNSFFNTDVLNETTEPVTQEAAPQSIFANPPQPIIEPMPAPAQPSEPVPAPQNVVPQANVPEPEVNQSVIANPGNVQAPEVPAINPTPAPEAIASAPVNVEQPINTMNVAMPSEPVVAPAPPQPSIPSQPIEAVPAVGEPVIEQPVIEASQPSVSQPVTPISNSPVMQTPEIIINNANQSPKLITDEEALKAINLIQEYITQEEKNNA